ncbi:lipase 3-like [Uranotaenia lowii]|uniref:lipase 3-like n=1 Tax=Uranotaenia lowii TaxID=190385 RepID=UPI002479FDBF|nr:lipase 3-like [Uranotaenia lowii]
MTKLGGTGVLLLVLICSSRGLNLTRDFDVDESDAKRLVPELIQHHGYPVQVHHVATEDGYVLEMHRIPGEPGSPVVFLMHGLLCSSADWIIIGPKHGLAYLLAQKGFDVWLGNARGNRYSRRHKTLTPNMFAFWQFSWHEIGYYDLPAMIDYVLDLTGQGKLQYVGHSQGTTSFFVMTSTRPEYNEKVHLMQALAPVAFTSHMRSPLLRVLSVFQETLTILFETFGIDEFKPNNSILHDIARLFCSGSITSNLCLNVLFQLAGADPDQVELKIIPLLVGHTPAGASTKQIVHYAQGVRTAQFRRYDFGKIKNTFIYGMPEPPEYNLTEVRTPVVFHYGLNDYLADPEDVLQLGRALPNLIEHRQVQHNTFNHLDFLFAKDVRELLYGDIIQRILTWKVL